MSKPLNVKVHALTISGAVLISVDKYPNMYAIGLGSHYNLSVEMSSKAHPDDETQALISATQGMLAVYSAAMQTGETVTLTDLPQSATLLAEVQATEDLLTKAWAVATQVVSEAGVTSNDLH
ncbi:hypothetical protein NVP1077O_59 [Vibrio phage 1.077.O._10N.261.45.A10]|nr:hypothetical protein NVP1070O_59 [Vibrio phage 1.070.O._10N.261.45.B2]AUR85637.1 hypothetical protein NVP1077O_59 [Vibrio phage 1.077.O._10N.261.45.A10]